MSGKTPGQAAYEAYVDAMESEPGSEQFVPYADWDRAGDRAAWEAAAAAAGAAERDELRERLTLLASQWEATAGRKGPNGQSLLNQGDEYGREMMAAAETLGDCAAHLRAALKGGAA